MTKTTKPRIYSQLESKKLKCGEKTFTQSKNKLVTSIDTRLQITKAVKFKLFSLNFRIETLKPRREMLATRVTAEMTAVAKPTSAEEKLFAAIVQKTKPKRAMIQEFKMRKKEFLYKLSSHIALTKVFILCFYPLLFSA